MKYNNMEPNVLLIGKSLNSLEILREELRKFDRSILIANSEESILSNLKNEKVDLIILGAGLPNETIESMTSLIAKVDSDLLVHVMEKLPGINPTSMIGYTNEKAVMWKLLKG